MSTPQEKAVESLIDCLNDMHIDRHQPTLSLRVSDALGDLDRAFDGAVSRLGLEMAAGRLRNLSAEVRRLEAFRKTVTEFASDVAENIR